MASIIFCLGILNAIQTKGASSTVNLTTQTVVTNAAPILSNVLINGGDPIVLIPDATTSVPVSFTVNDPSGCGDVFWGGGATTTLYRSGTASTSLNYFSSYFATSTVHNCPYATSSQQAANATATLVLYYFADATDTSSSYEGETWIASVEVRDGSNATSSASSSGVDLNAVLAIKPSTSTIDYGTVPAGQNSGSTNGQIEIYNAGNVTSSVKVSGTDLTSGANTIAVANQHYASTSFIYNGGEPSLSGTASTIHKVLSGPLLRDWQDVGTLEVRRAGSIVANGNYIYEVGGEDSVGATSSVFYASINSSGTLNSWQYLTTLPNPLMQEGVVVWNNRIYVLGGSVGALRTSTVLFAEINVNGSLGSWIATQPLPTELRRFATFARDGHIYVLGGDNDTHFDDVVYFAEVESDGSLGQWQAGTFLPSIEGYSMLSAAVSGEYVFMSGGRTGSSNYTSTVAMAMFTSTSSIGAWQTLKPLPYPIRDHKMFAFNGFLYVIGGTFVTGSPTSWTLLAPIMSDGSIGDWVGGLQLPNSLTEFGSMIHNGHLYIQGGYTTTVRFANLPGKSSYWGIGVPGDTPVGPFSGMNVFTTAWE